MRKAIIILDKIKATDGGNIEISFVLGEEYGTRCNSKIKKEALNVVLGTIWAFAMNKKIVRSNGSFDLGKVKNFPADGKLALDNLVKNKKLSYVIIDKTKK